MNLGLVSKTPIYSLGTWAIDGPKIRQISIQVRHGSQRKRESSQQQTPSLLRRVVRYGKPVASSFVALLVHPARSVFAAANNFMDCNLHNFFVRNPNLVLLVSLERS